MVWCLKIHKVHVAALSKFLIIKIKQCTTFDTDFVFLFNRFLQLLAFYFYWKIFSAFKTLVLLSLSLALFMPVNLHYWPEYLQLCWLLHTSGKGETFLAFSCVFFTIYCLVVYFWYVSFILVWFSVRLKIFDFLVAFNLSNI